MAEFIVSVVKQEDIDEIERTYACQELVRCKDCEYSYTEGFVNERLLCEKHPELGVISEIWFCADCWKA